MERVTDGIARTQDGLITAKQSGAAGLSGRGARSRVENGRWERPWRDVYRAADSPRSWRQDLRAAWLAAGPSAVVSHRAAAAMWELGDIGRGWLEFTVCRPQCHRLPGVIVHRSTDLNPAAAVQKAGLPITDPARTILDLGAVVPRTTVEAALESALGRRLVTVAGLRVTLERVARRGRRGAGVLRALLDERSETARRTESVLEERMLRALRRHSVRPPVAQYDVHVRGRFIARVDFAYPERFVALEVDGYETHSSLEAFGHDRTRQNDLVAAGWMVLRFTWDDVVRHSDRVARLVSDVLGALPA